MVCVFGAAFTIKNKTKKESKSWNYKRKAERPKPFIRKGGCYQVSENKQESDLTENTW